MPHLSQKILILPYLFYVLRPFASELEVNNNPFVAVGHYAIGATLLNPAISHAENSPLVEQLLMGTEPVRNLGMLQALAQHIDKVIPAYVLVVEYSVVLQLLQSIVYVILGADG